MTSFRTFSGLLILLLASITLTGCDAFSSDDDDSGLVTSLDLVELNPFLDERGRTANLMVDLCASLFGRTVLDRPTQSH